MSIKNNFSSVKPNLLLDFKNSKSVDSGSLFTRYSIATYTGNDGYIKYSSIHEPRFDHDPVTKECRGLLMEKGSTNRSIALGYYTFVRLSSFNRNYRGPDNIENSAYSFVPNATNGQHAMYQNIGTTGSNQDLAYSVFAKKGNSRHIHLHFGNYAGIVFDFDTGTVVNTKSSDEYATFVDYKVTEYPDGWYRLVIYGKDVSTSASYLQIDAKNDYTEANSYAFSGDGVTPSFYLYGGQAEWELNESSYIPSDTVVVARSADSLLIREENLNWINRSGMTLYVELESSFQDRSTLNNYMIATSNGSDRYLYANSANSLPKTDLVTYAYYDGNNNIAIYGTGAGSPFKITARISPTNYDTCVKGANTQSVTVVSRPHNGDLLNPANIAISTAVYKKIAWYPTLLTDEQMIALTQ